MLTLENESGKHVVRREKFESWPKMFQTCQFVSLVQLPTWAEPYFTLFITSKSVGVRFLDQKPYVSLRKGTGPPNFIRLKTFVR